MDAPDHVHINPAGYELAGMSRWGWVRATVEDFEAVFGTPAEHDPGGEKVSHYWYFETPRGRACVRNQHDYPRDLLCIASIDPVASWWCARYLRECKLIAYTGELR